MNEIKKMRTPISMITLLRKLRQNRHAEEFCEIRSTLT